MVKLEVLARQCPLDRQRHHKRGTLDGITGILNRALVSFDNLPDDVQAQPASICLCGGEHFENIDTRGNAATRVVYLKDDRIVFTISG